MELALKEVPYSPEAIEIIRFITVGPHLDEEERVKPIIKELD